MYGPYYLIFINSLRSSLILPLSSEHAWFAALQFGGYDVGIATLAAVMGSSVGTLLNFLLGYYLANKRDDWFVFPEALYQRLLKYNRYAVFMLLLPFSSLPFVGIYWCIFVMITGFLNASLFRAVTLIIMGRVLYYSFYLLH